MLLIDGDCGFCMRSAAWARRRVRPGAPLVPWQQVDIGALGLTPAECSTAVQWVQDGRVSASGGRAVCRTLATAPPPWPAIAAVMSAPGMAWVVDRAYEIVAANRSRLPGASPACAADGSLAPTIQTPTIDTSAA
jgi:hypothetical protein